LGANRGRKGKLARDNAWPHHNSRGPAVKALGSNKITRRSYKRRLDMSGGGTDMTVTLVRMSARMRLSKAVGWMVAGGGGSRSREHGDADGRKSEE
jgi:hypothetical protein